MRRRGIQLRESDAHERGKPQPYRRGTGGVRTRLSNHPCTRAIHDNLFAQSRPTRCLDSFSHTPTTRRRIERVAPESTFWTMPCLSMTNVARVREPLFSLSSAVLAPGVLLPVAQDRELHAQLLAECPLAHVLSTLTPRIRVLAAVNWPDDA